MNGLKIALYALCVMSSVTCTLLLLRGYLRERIRLLMWSAACFAGLTLNNLALFVDLAIYPQIDLRLARLLPALLGVGCLLYGFIWDTD